MHGNTEANGIYEHFCLQCCFVIRRIDERTNFHPSSSDVAARLEALVKAAVTTTTVATNKNPSLS